MVSATNPSGAPGYERLSPARVDWVGIAVFLAICFGFSWWCFAGLETLGVAFQIRTAVGMFGPALAALITVWIRGGTRALGLRVRPNLAYLYAYLLPPLLITTGIALSLGVGYQHVTKDFAPQTLAAQVPLAFSVGILVNTVFALGEELGWRGYLLPRLEPLGHPLAAVAVGVIWGIWHAPIIAIDGYEFGVKSWGLAPFFLLSTVPFGVILAWLRWRSASVWPCAVMHAGINAFAGLWLLTLTRPASNLIGSPVGLLGVLPFALFAIGLVVTGRLREPTSEQAGSVAAAPPHRLAATRVGGAVGILAVLVAGTLALAAATRAGTPLTGSSREAVLSYSEPATDNLMAGFSAGDYARASRDFDPVMRAGLGRSAFLSAREQLRSQLGSYLSRAVERVEKGDDTVTVVYVAQFSRSQVQMTVALHAGGAHQIAGWHVRP